MLWLREKSFWNCGKFGHFKPARSYWERLSQDSQGDKQQLRNIMFEENFLPMYGFCPLFRYRAQAPTPSHLLLLREYMRHIFIHKWNHRKRKKKTLVFKFILHSKHLTTDKLQRVHFWFIIAPLLPPNGKAGDSIVLSFLGLKSSRLYRFLLTSQPQVIQWLPTNSVEGWRMLPLGQTKPATHVFLNFCSCCLSRQCYTHVRKNYLPSFRATWAQTPSTG